MKISNAIKKVERTLGKKVKEENGRFKVIYKDQELSFLANGGYDEKLEDRNAICIRVRGLNDKDDSMTDYCAGSFYSNITNAIKYGIFGGNV